MRIRINADVILTETQAEFFTARFGDRAQRKAQEYILKYGMSVVEALGNESSKSEQEGHQRKGDFQGTVPGGVQRGGTG